MRGSKGNFCHWEAVACGMTVLLLALGLALAGCDTGSTGDPGGGGDTSGQYPPGLLADGTGADGALAALNAIIAYCNAHPTTTNNAIKSDAQSMKGNWQMYASNWNYGARSAAIRQINALIELLD